MQPEASCTQTVPVLAALGVPVGALYVICRHKGPSRPPMKEKRPLSVAELHQHTPLLKYASDSMLLTQSALHYEHMVGMPRSLSCQGPIWCTERSEMEEGLPVKPEGVFLSALAIQGSENELPITGMLQKSLHAVPPHSQYGARCFASFSAAA